MGVLGGRHTYGASPGGVGTRATAPYAASVVRPGGSASVVRPGGSASVVHSRARETPKGVTHTG